MDLSKTIEPKSDQINADDLIAGPRTFTIERVSAGNAEQPVNVHLVESPGRAYRPSKSMRRVLVAAWGADGAAYEGRQLTLYRNPAIKFGGIAVGGIEISHMSHIDKELKVSLAVSRGKRTQFVVQRLDAPVAADTTGPGITREQWNELLAAAEAVGRIGPEIAQEAAKLVGRDLTGWQEIPASVYDELLGRVSMS